MPLLAAGNTEFATSVTRKWSPHYKSSSIDLLEAALLSVQNNAGNARNLEFLYGRLVAWIQGNPNEFAKRGRLVGKLAYEIEKRAHTLGLSVAADSAALRLATTASAGQMWTLMNELAVPIAAHDAAWNITITDIPTAVPAVYNHTAEDRYSLEDRAAALAELGPVAHPERNARFWLRLGRHVLTPRADGHRYGRCYSCAAAVINTLVQDPTFDDYTIEHVAATNFDHHLVLLGRANANGVSNAGLNTNWNQWKYSAIIIDVWDENRAGTTNFAKVARLNHYAAGGLLTWYCAYTPAGRAGDRAFAAGLGPVVRVAARPAMVAAARLAVAAQGRASRQVAGPPRANGRPTWITQELDDDGITWRTV